jgi:hypothetical protein
VVKANAHFHNQSGIGCGGLVTEPRQLAVGTRLLSRPRSENSGRIIFRLSSSFWAVFRCVQPQWGTWRARAMTGEEIDAVIVIAMARETQRIEIDCPWSPFKPRLLPLSGERP